MQRLSINSTNVDWCGIWNKKVVENTMKETNIKGIDWIDYIFMHNFDDTHHIFPKHIIDTIKSVDYINLTFMFDGHQVQIIYSGKKGVI